MKRIAALHAENNRTGRSALIMGLVLLFCILGVAPALADELTLPAALTTIEDEAFMGNTAITSVVIPEGAASIGARAFAGCTNLAEVTIPASVTSIEVDAFDGCEGLQVAAPEGSFAYQFCEEQGFTVMLPSTDPASFYTILTAEGLVIDEYIGNAADVVVPSQINGKPVVAVDYGAFANNTSIRSVTLPASLKNIGDWVFMGCTGLERVTVLSGEAEIGRYAFDGCKSLVQVDMNKGATAIADEAFRYCENLVSITLGDGLSEIGECAFLGCSSLKIEELPPALTAIGDAAFQNCEAISKISIPQSVQEIGNSAFSNCISLEQVDIAQGVKEIDSYAFYNTALKTVHIPSTVTTLGEFAFSQNKQLTMLTIDGAITSCGRYAFSGCSALTTVELPEGITVLGEYAFAYCSSLKRVLIPASVNTIGTDAFAGCNYQITIYGDAGSYASEYASDNSITFRAFTPVQDLEYVIADGEATITGFTGNQTQIVLPFKIEGVPITAIGEEAFASCTQITSAVLLPNVRSIGKNAFRGCSALSFVELPDVYEEIGEGAFAFSAISSVRISGNIKVIGAGAFEGCTMLKESYIGQGVEEIGARAFKGCSAMTYGWIPESVKTIGEQAFMGCSAMTYVQILASVKNIGEQAFSGCTNLRIYGWTGTAAETAAEACGVLFVALGYTPQSDFYYEIIDDEVYINQYVGSDQEILIPPKIDGYPVVSVTGFIFDDITSIVLPASVKQIGDYAFQYCENLNSVEILGAVETIGRGAFYGCTALTRIEIPDGIKTIECEAFLDCTALKEVRIGKGLVSIASLAFGNCSSLVAVSIPDGTELLEDEVFCGCVKLEKLIIPASVTYVGSSWNILNEYTRGPLIHTDERLKNLEIYGEIGSEAEVYAKAYANPFVQLGGELLFDYDYGFVTDGTQATITAYDGTDLEITIPDTMEGYPVTCVNDLSDSEITSVTVPEGVTRLNPWAFSGCEALQEVILPQSLEDIGSEAFAYCSSLRSIVIPSSVKRIYEGAFKNCTALERVYIPGMSTEFYCFDSYSMVYHCIFYECPSVKIYTEYGAPAIEFAAEDDIPYFYLSLTDIPNLMDNYYLGDDSIYLGRLRSSAPITRVEVRILDGDGNIVSTSVAGGTGNTTLRVNADISALPLGDYRCQIHAWADDDGEQEYRTFLDFEFALVYPPLRVKLSSDFFPPTSLYSLGWPYIPEGSLIANNPIEKIRVSMTNKETGEVYYGSVYTPGTNTFSMTTLHEKLDFAVLPKGNYTYRIVASFSGKSRLVYSQNVMIEAYDGIMDESLAIDILEFCKMENNPTGVFDRFTEYQSILYGYSDLDKILMAMPVGNDWLVSNIVGLFDGSEGDAYIVNLYKKEILNVLQSMGEGPKLITIDADISIVKAFRKTFDFEEKVVISDLKERFEDTKTQYKLEVKEAYGNMLEGATEEEINELVESDLEFMSSYIDNLEDGLTTMSNVLKCEEIAGEALELFAVAMNDYQNMLAILDSLKDAYVGNLPAEYRSALEIIKAEYQSSTMILLSGTLRLIGTETAKAGIDLASKGFVNLLTKSSSTGGLALSCGKFAMDLAFKISGLEEYSDEQLTFVTQANLVMQNKRAYINAVYAVQDGDTSSEALTRVYVTYRATRASLLAIYEHMIENELHSDMDTVNAEYNLITNLSID